MNGGSGAIGAMACPIEWTAVSQERAVVTSENGRSTLAVSRSQRLVAARRVDDRTPCSAKLLCVGLNQFIRAHYRVASILKMDVVHTRTLSD